MKAVILYGPRDVRLGDFPVAPVTPGTVKVAVAWCGICGSDLHKFDGKKNTHPIKYPVPLGHEISGYVAEVGEGVEGYAVGDPVTVDPNWSCGKCSFCQRGMPSFCTHARGVVKGMAEYVVAPVENVYHLPAGLDLKAAALAEPLSCCLHGLDLLDIKAGQKVALVGFGAIGAMMLQLLRLAGAGEIVVLETNETKREAALAMGATRFCSPADEDAVAELADAADIDRVIECVGVSPAQKTALRVAGKGATVVLFGVSDEADLLSVSVYEAFARELTIKTSFVNPHTTQRAIDLLASGRLDTDRLISTTLEMEQVAEELETRQNVRAGKVLVRVGG